MEENGQIYFDDPDKIPYKDIERLKEAERELLQKTQEAGEAAILDLCRQEEEARTQPETRPRGEAVDEEAREGEDRALDEWFENWQILPTRQEASESIKHR